MLSLFLNNYHTYSLQLKEQLDQGSHYDLENWSKMLSSRKSWEFYHTFLLRLSKKLESEMKSWSNLLQIWS